jgi:transcriptional regulator with XRE-family HTH domain
MVLTVEQIRAARGILNWTRPDLAKAIGVHLSTIERLEKTETAKAPTLLAIRAIFEGRGIQFVPGGARLREQNERKRRS